MLAVALVSTNACASAAPRGPSNTPEPTLARSEASAQTLARSEPLRRRSGESLGEPAGTVRGESAPTAVPESAPSPQLSLEQLWARYNAARGDAYQLDATPRLLPEGRSRPSCDDDELVTYRGHLLSFNRAVRVHPAFAERLRRFEQVASEVATEFYGRPPRGLRTLGAFVCRKSRFRSRRISEHAFGNAIDVAGFDFGPAPKAVRASIRPGLRWSFRVGVERHWESRGGSILERHEEFLHELARRLVNEGVFRVALGPSHRGHHDHFHFDMSPWYYVHL